MLNTLLNIKLILDHIANADLTVEMKNAAIEEVKHNYLRSTVHGHKAMYDVLKTYADSLLVVPAVKKPVAKKTKTKTKTEGK